MKKKEGTIVTGKLTTYPNKDYPALDKFMPVEVFQGGRRKVLDIPVYGTARVGESECSKYVRMAASDLFGKFYSLANAWDRRYKDKIVCVVGNSGLEDLAFRKILLPGMIVGMRNPESPHKEDLDMTGKPAFYTHNVLYLGSNRLREPLFAEQFVIEINVRTEKDMRKSQLTPIEIIDVKFQGGKK